jgi:hypothetical protein
VVESVLEGWSTAGIGSVAAKLVPASGGLPPSPDQFEAEDEAETNARALESCAPPHAA